MQSIVTSAARPFIAVAVSPKTGKMADMDFAMRFDRFRALSSRFSLLLDLPNSIGTFFRVRRSFLNSLMSSTSLTMFFKSAFPDFE